jgi:heme/copper-type cytochrome/quinol oxidase subunit 4
MESASFSPSLAREILKNSVIGLILLVVVPVVIIFPSAGHGARFRFTSVSVAFLAISGIGIGLGYFLFFTARFLMSAPKRVVMSDNGLSLKFRNGKTTQIAWEEINQASLTSSFGLNWKVSTTSASVLLRDQGFSEGDFGYMSQLISARLAARQIQVSTDKQGQKLLAGKSSPK